MPPRLPSARYQCGSRKRPSWIFIRIAKTCWCWSQPRLRFTQWTRDNGVRGKRWGFPTRTRGRVICAEGWKYAAERSMFFFPARAATGRFLLRRSIAAAATIRGRLAKGLSRSLVREGISLVACWPARAQALLWPHFFPEQPGKAGATAPGLLPALAGTHG